MPQDITIGVRASAIRFFTVTGRYTVRPSMI